MSHTDEMPDLSEQILRRFQARKGLGERPVDALGNREEKKIPLLEMFGPTIEGEGAVIGVQTFFFRVAGCDYKCIEASQRVLMADMSMKPISEVKIGDMVMGMLDSNGKKNKRLVPTPVLASHHQGEKEVVEVRTCTNLEGDRKGPYKGIKPTSLLCTPDHQLLNVKYRTYWQEAHSCNDAILRAVGVYDRPEDLTSGYWAGWLHGVIQGDGSIHKFQDKWYRLKISCSDQEIIDQAYNILKTLGYNARKGKHNPGQGKSLLPYVEVTNNVQVLALKTLIDIGSKDEEYMQGWLAGFFDTDGHFDKVSGSIRISQASINKSKIDRMQEYCALLGFHVNWQESQKDSVTPQGNTLAKHIMRTGIIAHYMEFFTLCKPVLQRKYPKEIPIGKMPRAPVESIKYRTDLGKVSVHDITTGTGNFICEGIVVHNCKMCDSLHAVIPDQFGTKAHYLTQSQLFEAFKSYVTATKSNVKRLTLSGGNPCLYDFTEFLKLLRKWDERWEIFVETQGTFTPSWFTDVDHVTISPKGPGFGEKFEPEKYLQMVRGLISLETSWNTKIVVFDVRDLEFAEHVCRLVTAEIGPQYNWYLSVGNHQTPSNIEMLQKADPNPVYGGYDKHVLDLLGHYRLIIEEVQQRPTLESFIILPQMHVLLYGNKEKV